MKPIRQKNVRRSPKLDKGRDAANHLASILRGLGLNPVREFVIAETGRKWRYDIAFPEKKVAVEVHGGVWSDGRHTRGKGFIEDRQKMNAAQMAGWRCLEFTTDCLDKRLGAVVDQIKEALGEGGGS